MSENQPIYFNRNKISLQSESQKAFDFKQLAKMPGVRQQPQPKDK